MRLRRLEMQGFKTFAGKTVLEFSSEEKSNRGVTAIVGPNGSGKSNVADAIRWVMGEQSMKLLRGKKSEDLIFSGSEKKPRSGFAEVTMTLENDEPTEEMSMSEIVVTRRLYRDGKSEFEINRQAAKLSDITMLLAQSGIGQRTYSVIGQGMADAILSAGPAERKEFFDEAAGLRPFQLKRQQSVSKLESSKERLAQADILLREIAPRLSSLERQAKRLQMRDSLEVERAELERSVFGGNWHEISTHLRDVQTRVETSHKAEQELSKEAKRLEEELLAMEKAVPPSVEQDKLRQQLDQIAEERAELREKQASIRARIDAEKAHASDHRVPLSLKQIIDAVDAAQKKLDALLAHIESKSPSMDTVRKLVKDVHSHHSSFATKLQKPPEEPNAKETDPELASKLEEIAKKLEALTVRAQEIQKEIASWNQKEEGKRAHLFETQHALSAKRNEARKVEQESSVAAVELARWETRRDGFLSELRQHRPEAETELDTLATEVGKVENLAELAPKLSKVRSQLEWIGSIDPTVQKEYTETKERFEYLTTQSEDLRGAINGLETVIKELDETIRTRSEQAFHTLNSAFGKTFRLLFDGGEASLVQVAPEPTIDEEGNLIPPPDDAPAAGIDIIATPPGKRLKSIALLSGGERALTSIALISAIMATNPSPFIVLDEVDAALDELNTKRYADILGEYAAHTQFIIITHNRTTMHQANVLYGVTMGEDGTSKLLSVKLEEV
ncbi:MAG: AAA family ATPase [Patescibacteria group bacterium]